MIHDPYVIIYICSISPLSIPSVICIYLVKHNTKMRSNAVKNKGITFPSQRLINGLVDGDIELVGHSDSSC